MQLVFDCARLWIRVPDLDLFLAGVFRSGPIASICMRRLHLREIVAAEIAHGEFAEDVVEDRRRHLDVLVADDRTVGLEAREGEGVHVFFERHAVL